MFKNRSLEIEMIEKSMEILHTVIIIHLAGISIRICQYLFIFSTRCIDITECNPNSSIHILCILIYTIYFMLLIYQYLFVFPIKAKINQKCIETQEISKEQISEKMRYINSIGVLMIGGNLLVILVVSFLNIKKISSYYGVSEVFMYNTIICVFIFKNARLCISYTIFAVIVLNLIKITQLGDQEQIERIVSSINGSIITWCIMANCQQESEENYTSKKIIKEKKQMLRKILHLFPSGILFYSRTEGIFFKNKFWMDLIHKFQHDHDFNFWRNKAYVHKDIIVDYKVPHQNNADDDKETVDMLNNLYLRENSKYSLMDEILKIHSHFYEKNVQYNKIDEFGMDDFILNENLDFNEYEIKNVQGKQISEFSAKFSAFNFADEDKSIMVVINDISERARLRESKISEMLKTIMLCSISHELRSPVNQINGVLTLLLPTLSTIEQMNLIRIANSSTELLKLKVDDMLDFYEVETNNFKTDKLKFEPRLLLEHLRSIFFPIIDKNNIRILFYIHEKTPEVVNHDLHRIKQIMVNLISNAVKYTNKGIISVIINWKDAKKDPTSGTIQFSVSDTGCGIPKDKREFLFEFLSPENIKHIDFSESKMSNTTKLAGTGLGISQKIAEALGTKIKFSSIVGVGSRFWISLKVKRANQFDYKIHGRLIRCKTLGKEELTVLKKNNFTFSKHSILSQIKHYSLDRSKSDPNIELVQLENQSSCSLIEFSQFKHDEFNSQNFKRPDTKDLKNILKLKRASTKGVCMINRSKKQVNFEQEFEYSPIPSNENTTPVNYVPSFINRAADLTGKGFVKTKTEEASNKSVISNQKLHPHLSANFRASTYEVCRANEETKCTSKVFDAKTIKSDKDCYILNTEVDVNPKTSANFNDRYNIFDNPAPMTTHKQICSSTDDSIYPSIKIEQINPAFKKPCDCSSILIVDDQFINRFIIKQFCIKYDIMCQEAEDGKVAIDKVLSQTNKKCCKGFELILMDLNMPVLGGVESSKAIMELKNRGLVNQDLKIVAVTAFPSKTEKNKCASVGISEFIVKPFTITHFINLIRDQ